MQGSLSKSQATFAVRQVMASNKVCDSAGRRRGVAVTVATSHVREVDDAAVSQRRARIEHSMQLPCVSGQSWRKRARPACAGAGRSPISSRSSVPPSALRSSLGASPTAPGSARLHRARGFPASPPVGRSSLLGSFVLAKAGGGSRPANGRNHPSRPAETPPSTRRRRRCSKRRTVARGYVSA
jgi:hypothetical protein